MVPNRLVAAQSRGHRQAETEAIISATIAIQLPEQTNKGYHPLSIQVGAQKTIDISVPRSSIKLVRTSPSHSSQFEEGEEEGQFDLVEEETIKDSQYRWGYSIKRYHDESITVASKLELGVTQYKESTTQALHQLTLYQAPSKEVHANDPLPTIHHRMTYLRSLHKNHLSLFLG